MIKQILYFIFFVSTYSVVAQTTDTLKTILTPTTEITPAAIPQPTLTIVPTETLQPQATTTITPTLTVQPTPVITTTGTPTMPNIKHRRKKSETFKKENEEIAALYKLPFDKKQEIVLQNKRYRIFNNYVSGGIGQCYNSSWQDIETSASLDYNFHLKRNQFQTGFLLVGPSLRDKNVIQFHAGMGYRVERCNYHWSFYGGVSYSDGYRLQSSSDSVFKFTAIGVYSNIQFYYKLKFDYGLGVSAFIDANSKEALTGMSIQLFLSGAYKGLKKINYAKEEEKEK
jgi:hypothetical protein